MSRKEAQKAFRKEFRTLHPEIAPFAVSRFADRVEKLLFSQRADGVCVEECYPSIAPAVRSWLDHLGDPANR